jgi:hypothetical protein
MTNKGEINPTWAWSAASSLEAGYGSKIAKHLLELKM